MNIVISGARGFLARHLTRFLKDRGHSVVGVVRNSQKRTSIEGEHFDFICENSSCELENLFANFPIDVVIHTATNYGYTSDSEQIIQDNLIFPLNLLRLSERYGVELFINTDSYFNKTHKGFPRLRDYGLSKKAALLWLDSVKQPNTVTLRIEHMYGPNDRSEKFVASAIQRIAREQVPYFDATLGVQRRDFIFVSDVCEAYHLVCKQFDARKHENLYELGTSKSTSIKEFLEMVKYHSNSSTKIRFGALDDDGSGYYDSVANSVFASDFNFTPRVTLVSGIRSCFKSLNIPFYE